MQIKGFESVILFHLLCDRIKYLCECANETKEGSSSRNGKRMPPGINCTIDLEVQILQSQSDS